MFFLFIFLLAIFENWLVTYIHSFTFLDEIIAIGFFCFGLINLIMYEKRGKKLFNKIEVTIISLIIIFSLIGVLSSIVSEVDNTLILQSYTLFGDLKFFMIYFGARIVTLNLSKDKFKKILLKSSYMFSFICIILFILDSFLHFMDNFGVRFGIDTLAYGFGHPAKFVTAIIIFTALNLYFYYIETQKINYKYLLLNLILIITAGRVTTIAFYLGLVLIIVIYTAVKKTSYFSFFMATVLFLIVGRDRIINQFFGGDTEARGVLLKTAIQIAKDNSPLGSGLGTFGSEASRINYSQLYYQYNISGVWGLSEIDPLFITDSYWAMILGEYGFVGAIIMFLIMMLMLYNCFKNKDKVLGLIISIPMLYLTITSPIDSIVTSNSIAAIMLCTIFLLNISKNDT